MILLLPMAGFHSTGIFPTPGAGFTEQTHTDLKCNKHFEPSFKSKTLLMMSKSSDSSRHPDGTGADTGCILDVVLIEAF